MPPTKKPLTPEEMLCNILKLLTNEVDRDMPVTVPLAFALIAKAGSDGIDQGELQQKIQASDSGISRTVATLGKVHFTKTKPGLDLVEKTPNVKDNRLKVLKLTTKGQKLMAKIAEELTK